jgi:hypothetical protein
MANLTAHTNVYDSALATIEAWGYETQAVVDLHDDISWRAKKDVFEFFASNPIELLGLVAIHVHVAPSSSSSYWWTLMPSMNVGEMEDAAHNAIAPVNVLIRLPNAHETIRHAILEGGGSLEQAARKLGIARFQLELILAESNFSDLEEELE